MKNGFFFKILIQFIVMLGLMALANAQSGGSFQITQSVISGGGDKSAGGQFSINGTIGQAVAGTNSTSGQFNLQSGFWAGLQYAAHAPFDFDGDGKTDISIFRPAPGEWWINHSSTGQTNAAQFGASSDRITPADFTGDGRADIAIWRPSNGFWFIIRSEDSSFFSFPFGTSGDISAPGDYDGDGKFDATVFRPSGATWFSNRSSSGILIVTFGITGDLPVPNAFVP